MDRYFKNRTQTEYKTCIKQRYFHKNYKQKKLIKKLDNTFESGKS